MSWRVVAHNDLREDLATNALVLVGGFFALLFGGAAYAWSGNVPDEAPAVLFVVALSNVAAFLVPLIAVGATHETIAEQRETGQIRLTLGLPHTRRELVVGTFVGRAAYLVATIGAGVVVGLLVFAVRTGTVPLIGAVALLVATILLALTYAGVGVGASALGRSTTVASVVALGLFLLTALFWDAVPWALRLVLGGFSRPSGPPPGWAAVLADLDPITAYTSLARLPLAAEGAEPPLAAPVALLVLLAWGLGPLLAGAWRFERVDL